MRIHRIAARETNCYLLWGRRGVILIDAGPPGSAPTIIAGAKEAGGTRPWAAVAARAAADTLRKERRSRFVSPSKTCCRSSM